MIDDLRKQIQERLDQLLAEAEKLRRRTAPRATRTRVLSALTDGKAMTAGEVAPAAGLASGTVSTTLSKLAKSGGVLRLSAATASRP